MSTRINKVENENPRRVNLSVHTGAPQQPTPALVKPQEAAPSAYEPSTSYAAMLKEAYDGDSAEAMSVVANKQQVGGAGNAVSAARTPRERLLTERVNPANLGQKSAQLLEGLRNRKNAAPIAAGQRVAQGQEKAPSAKRAHDQLMLSSSKMGVSEVATHISLKSFINLRRILAGRNWMRRRSCFDDLMRAHMANIQGAGIK